MYVNGTKVWAWFGFGDMENQGQKLYRNIIDSQRSSAVTREVESHRDWVDRNTHAEAKVRSMCASAPHGTGDMAGRSVYIQDLRRGDDTGTAHEVGRARNVAVQHRHCRTTQTLSYNTDTVVQHRHCRTT